MLKNLSLLVGLFLLAGLLAAPAAVCAEAQVVVVDVRRAVTECNDGKKAQATLRQKGEQLQAEVNALNTEVQNLRKDLENNAVMLKPEAKLAKEREFERKMRQLNDRRRDAQQELVEAERDALQPIFTELNNIIQEIGAKNNYALIMDANTVIFAPKSADITQQVIAAYNKLHP